MQLEVTGASTMEWRRVLNLLTVLSLILASCGGGGRGDLLSGGAGAGGSAGSAGGMAVGGSAGGGVSGSGSHGGSAGSAGGKAVGGSAGGGVSGSGGNGGRAAGAGAGGSAGSAGGKAVGGSAGGGVSGSGGNGGRAGAGAGGSAGSVGGVGGSAGGGASGAFGTGGFGGAAITQPIDGGGTIQSLPISTNDLVFDSTRGVLYASMNRTTDGGNSVLTIDPASGTVTRALPVGGLPSVLAISDDCSALYVGINTPAAPPTATPQIDGADSVVRIDLVSMTAGPPVSLGENNGSKLTAGQIAAVPGSSTQYMVSRRHPGSIPDFAGLALYDGNTLLTQLDSFFGRGDCIAFIDRSTLVGCSNDQAPSELVRYRLTSTAITPGLSVRDAIAGGASTRIAFGSGWIFASDGHAVNATTLQPLGRYGEKLIAASSSVAPVPDPDGTNVWFLGWANGSKALLAFERTTFQLSRTIPFGPLEYDWDLPNASPLVRWSPTGFAFRTYQKLYVIKLPN
jgi:hypothetical protein